MFFVFVLFALFDDHMNPPFLFLTQRHKGHKGFSSSFYSRHSMTTFIHRFLSAILPTNPHSFVRIPKKPSIVYKTILKRFVFVVAQYGFVWYFIMRFRGSVWREESCEKLDFVL